MGTEEHDWQPIYGPRTATLGRWLVEQLAAMDRHKGFHVYYDHGDSRLPNVAEIKGFVGEAVGRRNRLTDVDILVAKADREILFLAEIEETPSSPQKYIGAAFSVLMCNAFAVGTGRRQQYFHTTAHSKLIIAGAIPSKRRLQKLYDIVLPGIAQFATQSTKSISPKNVIFLFSDNIDSTMERVRTTVQDILAGSDPSTPKLNFPDQRLDMHGNNARPNDTNTDGGLIMNDDWITIRPWSEFPRRIEQRCDLIAEHITLQMASGKQNIVKYEGSYSFKAFVKQRPQTVAKLIPQYTYSQAIVLVAFSPSLPEAKDFAKEFGSTSEVIIMRESFYAAEIPDDWTVERAAASICKYLHQAPPGGKRTISL